MVARSPFLGKAIFPIPEDNLTPTSAIQKVIYLRPKLNSLVSDLSQVTYEFLIDSCPVDPRDIYRRFLNPLNGSQPPVGNDVGWLTRTGLDIDLTALKIAPGPVAIAIHFDRPAAGDPIDFSFILNEASDLDPYSCLTFVDASNFPDLTLSWIDGDNFAFGADTDAFNDPVMRTLVFVCKLKSSGKANVIPFNIGVALSSTVKQHLSLPIFLDPEIKNDG